VSTLRGRLNGGLIAMLLVVFGLQWAVGSLAIRRVAEDQMLTRLEHDGDTLLAALGFEASGLPVLDVARLEPIYRQPWSGHYYVVQVGGLGFVSRSLNGEDMPAEPLQPGRRLRYHAPGPQNQPLLVLSRGFLIEGQAVTIAVGEDLTDLRGEIARLSLGYLVLILAVLGLAVILQTLDVRRALRPLGALRRELARVMRGESPTLETEVPGEIRPLVDEINRLLGLVQRRLQQSRTAVGNLAHALKTPLALLFRIAEDPELELPPGIRRQLQSQTAAIRERLERELKRARLAGSGSSAVQFNPRDELQVLAQVLDSVYRDKRLDIDLRVPDRPIRYDREDFLELVGNLADNACKWARRTVRIEVEEGAGLRLAVSDDGPGCAPEEAEKLARRGLRLDESKDGHGLGLAIARDIVEFYGGTLRIDRAPDLGGLRVRVEWPGFSGV
jgi:signal transduction histidine kinase